MLNGRLRKDFFARGAPLTLIVLFKRNPFYPEPNRFWASLYRSSWWTFLPPEILTPVEMRVF